MSIALLAVGVWLATLAAEPRVDVSLVDDEVHLEIDLGREVQPHGSDLDGDLGLIRTVPDWPWRCVLSDLTRLYCRAPAAVVPQATPFRIEVAAPLYDRNGERLPALALEADTGAPELDFGTRWIGEQPRLLVTADQPIDAASLQASLRLVANDAGAGTDARVEVAPVPEELRDHDDRRSGESPSFELRLLDLVPGAGYQLIAGPGVRSLVGPLRGLGSKPVAIEAPGPMYLETHCGARYWDADTLPCDPDRGMTLLFRGRPDAASLAAVRAAMRDAGLQIADKLHSNWRGDYAPPTYSLDIGALRGSHEYRIPLPPMHDSSGAPARALAELRLQTRPRRPQLRLEPAVTLAPQSPRLSMAGLRRPLLTQAWVDADGRRGERSSRPWQWRTPSELQAVALPAAPSDLMRRGGIERIAARFGGGQVHGMRVHAPFAVHALRSRTHAWVWLTRWEDAQPLAAASVDVVDVAGDGTLTTSVAAVVSDARGLARLALDDPPYWYSNQPQRWLRARLAEQTVYLPLALAENFDLGEDDEWSNWTQGELRAFVLSDKPLYRPGETVRFQAWLRRRDGAQATASELPAVVNISLEQGWGYGKRPRGPEFAVDRHGVVSGELRLPDNADDDAWGWEIVAGGDALTVASSFLVSRSEPLTLAVDFVDPPQLLRPGAEAELMIAANYFSGGAAAGLQSGASGITRPGHVPEVFPEWTDFTFANGSSDAERPGDCDEHDGDLPHTAEFARVRSDGGGRARVRGLVRLSCDFGVLEIAARAELPALGAAYGTTRRLPIRADRDYLGLRVLPFDGDQRQIQAILLDGDARPRAAAPISVRFERWQDGAWQASGECTLRPDGVDACFRPAGGSLRLHAQAPGARPVSLDDWDWHDQPREGPPLRAQWSGDGERLHFEATLPGAGSALLTTEQGTLVDARVLRWQDGSVRGELLRDELPAGSFDLGLLAMPSADGPARPQAQRLRARVTRPGEPAAGWLALQAVDAGREPGRAQTLRLRNDGEAPLDLALAVIDQGLVALAPEYDELRDPQGSEWAGLLRSFAALDAIGISALMRNPSESILNPRVAAGLADGAADEADWDDSMALETVEVTGSRIRAEDVYLETTPSRPGKRALPARATLSDALRRFEPVVRRRFSPQAHWQAGLRLAPGESRDLGITLPDNLTAWRVEAVAFAPDGHVERQLLTLTSARSIEVRPSLPAVVVAGDRVQAGASVYNGQERAIRASVELHWLGASLQQTLREALPLPARASAAFGLQATTPQPGSMQLLAAASAGAARDAALVEALVASPARIRQASDSWWLVANEWQSIDLTAHLGADRLNFVAGLNDVPMLPTWSQRMHDYPHRCFEQVQSRALAAALLRGARPDLAGWVDDDIIAAAWRERAGFLDDADLPVYFDPDIERADDFLPAYTAWIGARLGQLGHPQSALPDDLLKALKQHLPEASGRALERSDWSLAALNLRALRGIGAADTALEARWWEGLPKFRPMALAVALENVAEAPDESRRKALLARVDAWEAGRPVVSPQSFGNGHFIDHSAASHCALVSALAHIPGERARARRWFDGVASQYGDAAGHDSLALVACTDAALQLSPTRRAGQQQASIEVALGAQRLQLRLDEGQPRVEQGLKVTTGATRLRLRSDVDLYVGIEAARSIDARVATAHSVGATLTRTLEVRRGDRWEPAPARLRRGDWVRVLLTLDTPRALEMLALEEAVPGALMPVDTTLEAVADPWIRHQDVRHPWFFARQLGQPQTRFYATWLPPGRHQFGYVAEVRHAGDYAWLPATLTPMYGRVQRAETAASRLRVDP